MLRKVYRSSFLAIAAYTFNWSIFKLLQKQRRIVWLTTFAFERNWKNRKRYVESTVRKYIAESTVHGTWEHYRISLPMPK